jgi:hypothetical protein
MVQSAKSSHRGFSPIADIHRPPHYANKVSLSDTKMNSAIFGIGILIAFAAIPYAIFKFVVKATERDLAEAEAVGDSDFVAEGWLWAALKSGTFFAIVGPLVGTILFTAPIVVQTGGAVWGLISMPLFLFPVAVVVSIGGAFVAGVAFGFLLPMLSMGKYPQGWIRLVVGAITGAGGGLLLLDVQKLLGFGFGALLGAASGAVCGLLVRGRVYRKIFQSPKDKQSEAS